MRYVEHNDTVQILIEQRNNTYFGFVLGHTLESMARDDIADVIVISAGYNENNPCSCDDEGLVLSDAYDA